MFNFDVSNPSLSVAGDARRCACAYESFAAITERLDCILQRTYRRPESTLLFKDQADTARHRRDAVLVVGLPVQIEPAHIRGHGLVILPQVRVCPAEIA